MKKTILFAFAAMVAFASCDNKSAKTTDVEVADSVEVSAEVQDAAVGVTTELAEQIKNADAQQVNNILVKIQEKYSELVKEGKLEEAKTYASAVQKYIADNADQIKSFTSGNETVAKLVDAVKNLPTNADVTVEQALSAVKVDAQAIVDKQVENATNAANAKVEEAKAKVNDAVNAKVEEAKSKANEAASKAINDAASKLLGK